MRRKLALAALGLGVAAAILPVSSASAFCDPTWKRLTGDCNACYTTNELTGQTRPCAA